jgi:hypothetical protein
MEAFWAAATQAFWWTMFVICGVGFVAMSIVLFCMALHMRDKAKLAKTK